MPGAWQLFERALVSRPPTVDVTLDGVTKNRADLLAMTLRALGNGAAQGFSEWGDRRAVGPLLAYVSDLLNDEESRLAACAALGWVMAKDDLPAIVIAMGQPKNDTPATHFRRSCLLESLAQRPKVFAAKDLLPLLTLTRSSHLLDLQRNRFASADPRAQVARALAKSTLDPATERALEKLLGDPELKTAAALALLLGGRPATATRALERYSSHTPGWLETLAPLWFESFPLWSQEALDAGVVYRYVENARVLARVTIDGTAQTWARGLLRRRLAAVDVEAGPHSLTRVRLRYALNAAARASDKWQSEAAMRTLGLLGEQGALAALSDLPAPTGELARAIAAESAAPEPPTTGLVPEEERE